MLYIWKSLVFCYIEGQYISCSSGIVYNILRFNNFSNLIILCLLYLFNTLSDEFLNKCLINSQNLILHLTSL